MSTDSKLGDFMQMTSEFPLMIFLILAEECLLVNLVLKCNVM